MMEPPSFSSGKAFCTVNSVPLTFDVEESVEVFFGDGPKGNEFANAGAGEHNIDALPRLSDSTNRFAVANPIPSVPPVMTAVLPSSFLLMFDHS